MTKPPRIWISSTSPKKGDVLRVRAQIEHIMESGLRRDSEGRPKPRNIVTTFEARLGKSLMFKWEPGISMAQNPYVEFTFLARESGDLHMLWKDDEGKILEARRNIAVA